MDDQLAKIREWAQGQLEDLDDLNGPPWARGRSQHLIGVIDDMLAAQATYSAQSSRRPPERSARCLPRCAKVIPLESARRRRSGSRLRLSK